MGQRHHPSEGGGDEVAQSTPGSRTGWLARGRGAGLAAIALVVVALVPLAVVMRGGGTPSRSSASTPGSTPTVRPYSGPRGQWVPISGLTGGTSPELSPLDPNIAYQTMYDANPPSVRRSDDGGATWQTLPIPSIAGLSPAGTPGVGLLAFPSPRDADTVFLVINVPVQPNTRACPPPPATAARAVGALASASGIPYCQFSYISPDRGVHWRHVALPDGDRGFLGGDTGLRPSTAVHRVVAQGSRLYSFDHVEGSSTVAGYLVASDDGGLTWRAIDAAIRARGQSVLDYAGVPGGSTLFAVSTNLLTESSFDLWRTEDGGAHWVLVREEPFASFGGLAVVAAPAGQTPLLYIAAHSGPGNSYPAHTADFHVSQDGGQTWRDAPSGGIPDGDLLPGILGVLGDGAIVVQTPAGAPSGPVALAFYMWRLGQSSWRRLTPPVVGAELFTITPAGPVGPEALWVATPRLENGDPSEVRIEVRRYVLS